MRIAAKLTHDGPRKTWEKVFYTLLCKYRSRNLENFNMEDEEPRKAKKPIGKLTSTSSRMYVYLRTSRLQSRTGSMWWQAVQLLQEVDAHGNRSTTSLSPAPANEPNLVQAQGPLLSDQHRQSPDRIRTPDRCDLYLWRLCLLYHRSQHLASQLFTSKERLQKGSLLR